MFSFLKHFSSTTTIYSLFLLTLAQAEPGRFSPSEAKNIRLRSGDPADSRKNQLIARADPPAIFNGQVSWTDWTAGDGQKTGGDADGVWYVADAISLYLKRFPLSGKRTGVFWAGGATTEDDFETVDEFLEINLNFGAQKADTVYSNQDFLDMNLNEANKATDQKWWRAINRMSKALAATCTNGVAYVYLKNNNCRTLFSPSSQNPMDNDPTANGQATNGEIWYYAELPTLMRNTNINQIKTFSKVNRKYVINTEWDVNVDTDKPRDFLPDIAMDATPIILPAAAGRPPMKRAVLPADSASSGNLSSVASSGPATSSATGLTYQQGIFDVKTLYIPGLIANSATTCTATSGATTITTTVPIWSCTACFTPYNALFVSPVSVSGPVGIPSPPPSYPALEVGADMSVTPAALPTGSTVAGGVYSFVSATSQGSSSAINSNTVSLGNSSGFASSLVTGVSPGSLSGLPSSLATVGVSTLPGSPISSNSSVIGSVPTASGGSTRASDSGAGAVSVPTTTAGVLSSAGNSANSANAPASHTAGGSLSVSSGSSLPGSITTNMDTGTSFGSIRGSLLTSAPSVNATSTASQRSSSSSLLVLQSSSQISSMTLASRTTLGTPSSKGPSPTAASLTGGSSTAGSNQATSLPPASTTIAAVGLVAMSSASALQSHIAVIGPIIQNWIDNPSCTSCSTDAINAIKGVIPIAQELEAEIGPNPNPKPCGVSANPITDIFNAVSCVEQGLTKTVSDIEADTPDDVTDDLTDLNNLQKPLENDEDNDDPSGSSTQASSQPSTSAPTSSVMTSSTSSFSTSTSSSVSSSTSSAAACAWNPVSDVSNSIPLAQFSTTAWWDYGISCAGACSDFTAPAASVSGAGVSLVLASDSMTASSGSGATTSMASSTATPSKTGSASSGNALSTQSATSTTRPASTASVASPDCMPDGAPWFSPTSWCDCGSATYAPLGVTSSQANCAFSELPSSTINPVTTTAAPTNIPGQNGLPGCNYVLAGDEQGCAGVDYCDCGGTYTRLHTASISGTASYNCDYTLQPTANDCPINTASVASASLASVLSASSVAALPNPTPTGTTTCFPWHDSFDLQQAMTNDGIQSLCSGNQADWLFEGGGDPESAVANNYVSSGYTLADDAPPQCKDLYTNGMSPFVASLCALPLQRILSDCGYNGGSVSNVCGSWWMQTCPLGITCPVGCPGGSGSCGTPTPYPKPTKRSVPEERDLGAIRFNRWGMELGRFAM